ncbi:DUF3526 domain-containing protein [Chitinophaga sp. G-6-1-13]|uniref:DUF3526 domain-containing protein n=1 Tax=Chitinophaga fulva TaxID=2728842 RepID=A0A848GRP6_9BACT|nr:DUF3526 domain-containing protein [Chitinophaga fulva]NML41064.1 DUF3526 domain-containing protein [Chitinophaga fulva]
MISIIAIKEWHMVSRNYTMAVTLLSALVLSGIAAAGSRLLYRQEQQQREAANRQFRQQWEQLRTDDPHSAAHFGTYIFKPLTPLSRFDNGLAPFTGNAMRIEAHVQHNMATPPPGPADLYLRFGALTPATVLQLFFPLFLFFLCFNSYTQEKTSGTLRLQLIQGATLRSIIRGKALLYLGIMVTILLLSMLLYFPMMATGSALPCILLLVVSYGCYAGIFVLLGLWLSTVARHAGQSLLLLCGIWLCWHILLPRLAAATGEALYPLPSQPSVQEKIDQAIKTGIDGNDPRDARTARLEQSVLQQYKVSSLDQLPVNFDAIRLQADEDYTQRVYEKYAVMTDSLIRLQNSVQHYLVLADPYLAIRGISMALCGTDYEHQYHFNQAAVQYRNAFIRRLNNAMADGGEQGHRLYEQMPAFQYEPPATIRVLRKLWLPSLSLLLWLMISISLLNRSARHASIQ